jgi:hypothetical protein
MDCLTTFITVCVCVRLLCTTRGMQLRCIGICSIQQARQISSKPWVRFSTVYVLPGGGVHVHTSQCLQVTWDK